MQLSAFSRIVCVALATLAVVVAEEEQFHTFFAIVALGHYFGGHFYHASEEKRVGPRYIGNWLVLAAALYLVFLRQEAFVALHITAFLIFGVHALGDDRRLGGGKPSRIASLEMVPFYLAYAGTALKQLVGAEVQTPMLWAATVLAALLFVWCIRRPRPDRWILVGWTSFMLAAGWLELFVDSIQMFGFISLYHALTWYALYLERARGGSLKAKAVLFNLSGVNAVIILAFYLTQMFPGTLRPIGPIFNIHYSSFLGLIHIAFTLRHEDILFLRQKSPENPSARLLPLGGV